MSLVGVGDETNNIGASLFLLSSENERSCRRLDLDGCHELLLVADDDDDNDDAGDNRSCRRVVKVKQPVADIASIEGNW